MGMAITLKQYLNDCQVSFEEIEHPYQATSISTANSAHIASEHLAKGVLLYDEEAYVMAVLPSDHMIDLEKMNACFDRRFKMANESEIEALFEDCDPGAVPPIGAAYGMKVMWDDSLSGQPDIYFEGGDHRTLIHISGDDFGKLMAGARHAGFSTHV
ncbi:MAG: YbaK/EbsC family protein [Rhodospirillaceae bacterium]|nr:YbaK/EbsC family protein [Rhodospirillaceae bacterium]MBL6941729.1 YbaK/EbsC family protein [Rhodospirillales bacterium]